MIDSAFSVSYVAYQSIKPCANRYLQKKWDKSSYERHIKKLSTMKSAVDNTLPYSYNHKYLLSKKEENYQGRNDKNSTGKKKEKECICLNQYEYNLKKAVDEQYKQDTIRRENKLLLRKLTYMARDSEYQRSKLLEESRMQDIYKKRISKYPLVEMFPSNTNKKKKSTNKKKSTSNKENCPNKKIINEKNKKQNGNKDKIEANKKINSSSKLSMTKPLPKSKSKSKSNSSSTSIRSSSSALSSLSSLSSSSNNSKKKKKDKKTENNKIRPDTSKSENKIIHHDISKSSSEIIFDDSSKSSTTEINPDEIKITVLKEAELLQNIHHINDENIVKRLNLTENIE